MNGTDKSGIGETDIKAGVGVGKANKSSVGGADSEVGKKADIRIVTITDNNADNSSKITD